MLTEKQLIENMPYLKKYAIKLSNKYYSRKLNHEYEDLLQDTLVRAWTKRCLYDPSKGSAKNWLIGIMHNIYVASLCEGTNGGNMNKVLKKASVCIDDIILNKKINPNQEHRIAFKEAQKLPNFDLSLANALGYSLEDIMEQLEDGQSVVIGRTCLYNNIQRFRKHKEEYV